MWVWKKLVSDVFLSHCCGVGWEHIVNSFSLSTSTWVPGKQVCGARPSPTGPTAILLPLHLNFWNKVSLCAWSSSSWLDWQSGEPSGPPVSASLVEITAARLWAYHSSWVQNPTHPPAATASALLTEPSPHPWLWYFYTRKANISDGSMFCLLWKYTDLLYNVPFGLLGQH